MLQPMSMLEDDIAAAVDRAATALAIFRERKTDLARAQRALLEALESVDASWSQSNIGYHADLYFGDFERPSLGLRFDPEWGAMHGLADGWQEREPSDVEQAVTTRSGIAVDQFVEDVDAAVRDVREAVADVGVTLAPIRGLVGLEREANLLDDLSATQFAPSVPFNLAGGMTRDSTALAQGMRAAPHQVVAHRVRRAAHSLAAADEAVQAAHRLAREVLARVRSQPPQAGPDVSDATRLVSLLGRFSDAARALRDRQRGRQDFEINDEYDVQDLVLAFLRLHFDDVRAEEWSPSYLGASTRIDFLLKQEGIVVETKMTREGLTARRLGEELAVDAARYRAHPDAGVLVCFIHDPEHRVTNPHGIETDLAQLSDDNLEIVAVFG
jgi:hypothetical protein